MPTKINSIPIVKLEGIIILAQINTIQMKQLNLFFIFSVLSVSVFAQMNVAKKDVPSAVVKSYLSQNSKGATDSIWTKETTTIYKVHFVDEGEHYEAHYFADGRWIKTYREIDQLSIPISVTNRAKEMYTDHKIIKAYIELNNDGKFYALDLLKGNDKLTVYFTMGGKFVK
jgi:hypothetical protein